MLLTILWVVLGVAAALIALVLIAAAMKPNQFSVKREAVIAAPPERIFGVLQDFHQWKEWSPWERLDPQLKRSYSGSAAGVGAVYEWEGNNQVGQGRMEVLKTTPPNQVDIRLDFIKPFRNTNQVQFTLTPAAGGTGMRWEMQGPNPFMMKVFQTVMNMDKLIGRDFEKGLANLKEVCEK